MPASPQRIADAVRKSARALAIQPESARRSAATTVTLREGVRCEIVGGAHRLVSDLSEKSGGEGAGPDPGVLGRGALGACVAMNVARRAAVLGVPLAGVEVRVEADYDARGEYSPGAGAPGYDRMRVWVRLDSDAPAADLARVMAEAEQCTAFLDTFRRPVDVSVETTLATASGEPRDGR